MDAHVMPPESQTRPPRKSHLRRWRGRIIAVTAIVVIVATALAWSFRPQPVASDFAAVTRGDLVVTVEDEGETRIHDVYVVSAPVAGRVQRIELEVGDEVVADETVLALFEPADPALYDVRSRSEAEAGAIAAQADVGRARAEVEFATAELRRNEELRTHGTVAQVTLDRARLALKSSQATLEQALALSEKRKKDLASARSAVQRSGKVTYVAVRAPVSGRVLKRIQQSETILSAGTPILEIGNPAKLEIVADFLSAEAVKVHEGDRVIIEEWGGPRPLAGVVRRIEPFGFTKVSALGIEEQRVNVVMDFTSPASEWKALGHGFRVMSRIVIGERKNVLKVPVSALFRSGNDWTVFVYHDGRAQLRAVGLGERNTLEAEVTNGLAENEQVIVHPSDQVMDNVRIAPRN